jgi:hypothetical protein
MLSIITTTTIKVGQELFKYIMKIRINASIPSNVKALALKSVVPKPPPKFQKMQENFGLLKLY